MSDAAELSAALIARIEEFLGDAEHFELADGGTVDITPAGKALDGLKEIYAAQAQEIEQWSKAMETCAECGKPILMNEPSYYRMSPTGCGPGKSYHSACGDIFGTKALLARAEAAEAQIILQHLGYLESENEWKQRCETAEARVREEQEIAAVNLAAVEAKTIERCAKVADNREGSSEGGPGAYLGIAAAIRALHHIGRV